MTTTLLDPPAEPPLLTPGGRTAVRAALVIAGITVTVTTLAVLTVAALQLGSVRMVTDHHALPTTLRALTVDTGNSPAAVRIVSDSDATEPRVDVRMLTTDRRERDALTVTDEANGTLLRFQGQTSFLAWGDPGEITITVPPELGRRLAVTVNQDNGVLMADADLDELTATSTDGAVLLRGAVRRVDVRAQDGDIRARQPISVSESFTASTLDGDVQVRFADAPPRIDATSRDGDVSIALPPPGPYLVRAQSGDGAVRVGVPETTDPAKAAADITVRSNNGEVSVDTTRAFGR